MISVRVSVCVILVVWGLDFVRANNRNTIEWSGTLNFVYKKEDELNIKIILRNLPPGANNYALFYTSDSGPVRSMPSDETIDFTHTLIDENFTLVMHVLEGMTIRSNKTMTGRIADADNSSAEEDEGQFEAECLNKDKPCQIIVDFRKNGAEVDRAPKPAINCNQDGNRYTCKTTYKNSPRHTEHQWYQKDENGTLIGAIPKVKGKKAIFKFEYQKFDKKSDIFYFNNEHSNFLNKNFESPYYENYTKTATEEFSDKKEFYFTCPNVAYPSIGLIDPTGYRITTYDQRSRSWNFNKANDGSMLCCLHYKTYMHDSKWVIERLVRNITLLVYKEAVNRDNGEATTTTEQSSSTSKVTSSTTTPRTKIVEAPTTSRAKPTTNTNTLKPAPAQTSTKSPDTLTTPEPAGSIDGPSSTYPLNVLPQSSDNTKYYIAMVSTAGAILLVSLIYVLVKKCTRKAPDPDEILQLETYASTNMVYAELDITPGKTRAAPTTEDSAYAEIIGVLRPRNE